MKKRILAVLAVCVVAGPVQKALGEEAGLKTEEQKVGYAIGMQIGETIKSPPIAADPDFLGKGVTAVMTYAAPLMTSDLAQTVIKSLPSGPKELPTGDKNFKDTKEEVGYALGLFFGYKIKSHDPKTDVASLVQGLKDTLGGGKVLLATNEFQEIFKAEEARQAAELKEQGEKNIKDGPAFMEKNKSAPGVKVLTNGLQYQILSAGTGPIPKLRNKVTVSYRGSLMSGEVFDASEPGEPVTFPVWGVVKGWTRAMQMMPTGSKWRVFIPADLAYGEQMKLPMIAPNSPLIFEIELVKIAPAPPASPTLKAGEDFLEKNAGQPGVIVLNDGLQYKVISEGTGPKPKPTDMVKVNYRGTLVDGTEFDASPTNQPREFPVSRVIPGWTEALQLMATGSKWQVFIPDYLAYGEQPPTAKIPPDSALVFEVELVGVEAPAVPPGMAK